MTHEEEKQLIRKFINNTCSKEELQQVRRFFLSPGSKEFFNDILDEYRSGQEEQAPSAMHDIWKQEFLAKIEKPEPYKMAPSKKKRPAIIRYAVVWAAVIAGICLILPLKFLSTKNTAGPVFITRSNPNGQRSKIILPDSSVVILAAGSSLKFPSSFSDHSRDLYLQGEAFFDVVADKKKPFIVHTNNIRTTVLGTSFNVNSYRNVPSTVTVVTGKVSVSDQQGKKVYLHPGQQVSYRKEKQFSPVLAVSAADEISWTKGTLNLNNKSMKEAALMLERWYGSKIIIDNPSLGNCILVGTHTNESLDNVLKTLQFVLHFKYTYSHSGIHITGKGCN